MSYVYQILAYAGWAWALVAGLLLLWRFRQIRKRVGEQDQERP